MALRIDNPFLRLYLEYVEDTESPRLMHIWSAIAGVSACLGRRTYLPFGIGPIYSNLFVLLVGPPGMRKSTAIKICQKRIRHATGVRFAPDDTSGQRQGLISALANEDVNDPDLEILNNSEKVLDLEVLGNIELKIDIRDRHYLWAVASEFSSFIGTNSREMVKFLGKMWDGEDYDYRLKGEQQILKEPLLSFIGGTSPTQLVEDLPPGSIGQGFTSRIIFVYGNEKYKQVEEPPPLPVKLEKEIDKVFSNLYFHFEGPVARTPEAKQAHKELYHYDTKIQDTRFIYYIDRRHQHLIKLSMILAASRMSDTVELADVTQAQNILIETEKKMPEALGEFGLSPAGVAKQRILEFIQQAREPVSEKVLWAMMNKDFGKRADMLNSMIDLVNTGKIVQVETKYGKSYIYKDIGLSEDILQAIAGEDEEEDEQQQTVH